MMKLISSLILLTPALAMAAEERDLQIADWHVTITAVTSQGLEFETGAGGGTNPNIKVAVSDLCRLEGATRTTTGNFYPTSNVLGIDADGAGIVGPGNANSLDWVFVEGINGNADIYTDNGDNTATVDFCIMVGLYEDTVLIDYAESKMTYNIDLTTNIPTLTGYTVTQAEAFNDAADTNIAFDGTLMAYFCNATTKEALTNDGSKTHQGSILNVCFKVPDGQFEVSDVMEFTVKNAGDVTPSQLIITGSAPASALYATKDCTDTDNADTNICVVSFLLKADFYDYSALTLTGTGSVLLEFGDASGSRRRLRRRLAVDPVEEEFQVTAHEFNIEQNGAGSSAGICMTSLAAFGAIAGAALAL
jgi:hypothetical protein